MLQSMGSQTARHNRATEQQQQNIYLDKRKLKKKARSLRWRKPNIINIKTKTS